MKSCCYNILVVDDDKTIRELLSSALTSEGHTCHTAVNGVEALEKCDTTQFDAVISDVSMPEMDGLLLTAHLTSRYPDLPVILMTGFVNDYTYDEAVEAGAADFINKPFSVEEFYARLYKVMHNHETFCQIKIREMELEDISRQMINGIEKDAMGKIADLESQLAQLRNEIGKS